MISLSLVKADTFWPRGRGFDPRMEGLFSLPICDTDFSDGCLLLLLLLFWGGGGAGGGSGGGGMW